MRLPLLVWIRQRDDPLFFITEASKATGFDHQHVAKEFKTFVDLGLLAELPWERKNDRRYFRREDGCSLWAFVDIGVRMVHEGVLT